MESFKYHKLRGRIIELYGSQDKFSEKLGVSRVSVSKKINGGSGFSQSDIEKWSNLLVIDKAEYGDYFFA